jgi:negative regulator of flagellin synthesis FlgM
MEQIGDNAMAKKNKGLNKDFIENLNFEDTVKKTAVLKAIILNAAETNETKIGFLKEEIAAGRYQINSQRIAEKLLEQQVEPVEEVQEVETAS